MNPSHRIGLNAAAAYGRSVVGAGLSLLSGRWVLNALGHEDYGLFSIVGAILVFVTFLNTFMAESASRYFAFYIGRRDTAEVNHWFNLALGIHLAFAVALTLVGWPIGEYVLAHVLKIPPQRLEVSLSVFRISMVSAFVSMAATPFAAMFTAKQCIAELSFWGTLQSLLAFVLAAALTHMPGDRLVWYAIGMTTIIVLVQSAQIIRGLAVFDECRVVLSRWIDSRRLADSMSFAVWNLMGSLGYILSTQGLAVLLNLNFGPRLNAAFGIATQVSTQTGQLSNAMSGAFSPEITAAEGRGDRERMLSLAQRASKIGTLLGIMFAVPLIAEMDCVLRLWLRDPPPYTAAFCQFMLIGFVVDRLTTGYMLAVNACGKIAGYVTTLSLVRFMALPLAWVFLRMGFPPPSVTAAFVAAISCVSVGRVLWVRRLLGVSLREWLRRVVAPSAAVGASAALATMLPRLFLPPCPGRLVLSLAAALIAFLVVTWLVGFTSYERTVALGSLRRVAEKLLPLRAGGRIA